MGYNKEAARVALKKCNNIISDSIQYIQENPGPSGSRSSEICALIDDLIPEVRFNILIIFSNNHKYYPHLMSIIIRKRLYDLYRCSVSIDKEY